MLKLFLFTELLYIHSYEIKIIKYDILLQVMIDKETKFDKWVRKLHSLRQKIISELNHTQ